MKDILGKIGYSVVVLGASGIGVTGIRFLMNR